MYRPSTAAVRVGFVVAGVAALVSCGTTPDATETAIADSTTTAAATPAPTTTVPTVTDVDPARFESAPGWFRFAVQGTPGRECAIAPALTGTGHDVHCSVTFPAGTPDVSAPPFSGEPNSIVLTGQGYYRSISEGGPPGAVELPVGARLTVGDVNCTVVDGGFECTNGANHVRFVDGTLALAGTEITSPAQPTSTPAATTAASAGDGPPMGHYTDGTTPAAPGTVCGAATGRRVTTVASGAISCADALDVIDTYYALLPGNYGNANIRQFDGWSCSTSTAAKSRDRGYSTTCLNGDIELRMLASSY